jgi:hypothetical protein
MSIAEKKMFGKNKRGENGGEKRDPLPKKGRKLGGGVSREDTQSRKKPTQLNLIVYIR